LLFIPAEKDHVGRGLQHLLKLSPTRDGSDREVSIRAIQVLTNKGSLMRARLEQQYLQRIGHSRADF
jgi:hypothetical protein